MKATWIALVLGLLLGTYMPSAVGGVPVTPVRKSADGLELPPASPERKYHSTVAIAGPLLGVKPEEVGRVFSTRRSAAILARKTTEDLQCDWFVQNVAGCDVAGLGLAEGRVIKVVLFYVVAPPPRVTFLHKQIDAHADPLVKVTFSPIGGGERKPSLMVSFELDAIESYLATHAVDPKIADALRHKTWLESMNDEQALLVGDGPGTYVALYPPDGQKPDDSVGGGTIFAESATPDVRIEIQARNKEEASQQAAKLRKYLKSISKVSSVYDNSSKAAAKK